MTIKLVMTEREHLAYKLGREAFYTGDSSESNPFNTEDGADVHSWWRVGYFQTKRYVTLGALALEESQT